MQLAFLEFDPQNRSAADNVELIAARCRKLERTLIALPEFFLGSFTNPEPVADDALACLLAPLIGLTETKGLAFVGSLPVRITSGVANRAVLLMNGRLIPVYDKMRPFDREGEHIIAGEQLPDVHGFFHIRFSVQICFDNISPLFPNNAALNGMDVLIAPSTVSVSFLRDVLRTRALENQIITIFCNRTGSDVDQTQYCGGSAFFLPDGSIHPPRSARSTHPRLIMFDPDLAYFARLERRRGQFLRGSTS